MHRQLCAFMQSCCEYQGDGMHIPFSMQEKSKKIYNMWCREILSKNEIGMENTFLLVLQVI